MAPRPGVKCFGKMGHYRSRLAFGMANFQWRQLPQIPNVARLAKFLLIAPFAFYSLRGRAASFNISDDLNLRAALYGRHFSKADLQITPFLNLNCPGIRCKFCSFLPIGRFPYFGNVPCRLLSQTPKMPTRPNRAQKNYDFCIMPHPLRLGVPEMGYSISGPLSRMRPCR